MPRKASKILSKKEEKAATLEKDIAQAEKAVVKAQKIVDKLVAKRKPVVSTVADASVVEPVSGELQVSTTEGEVANVQS